MPHANPRGEIVLILVILAAIVGSIAYVSF